MLRLSRFADYGILLTGRMSREPDAVHNAVDLAAATGLPAPTASKVLARLARHGVLESVRGKNGGFRLLRAAREVSAEDIIAAVDGPIALTMCLEEDAECGVASFCPSRSNLQRINEAVRDALRKVTLEDLAAPAFPAFAPGDGGAARADRHG